MTGDRQRAGLLAAIGASGLTVIAAGVAVLYLLGRARREAPPSSTLRVALIGDSLAVGLARPLRALVEKAGGTLDASGRSGTTISQWLRGPLTSSLARARPDLVLVSLGTNDMKARGDKTADAVSLAGQVRAAGADLMWIDPPIMPFGDPTGVRSAIRAAVPIEAIFPSASFEIPRARDGIHPTEAGYAAWADSIWGWYLSRIGAQA